jgi:hypothetical protein
MLSRSPSKVVLSADDIPKTKSNIVPPKAVKLLPGERIIGLDSWNSSKQ